MNDVAKVGKLGLRALLYFMTTTLFAVTVGLVVPTLLKGVLPTIHCFVIHASLVYSSAVGLLGGLSPLKFFKEMQPAMLFAFSSDSSVATLPYTMQCTEKMGVNKDIGRFVLSLGATINMDGVAIYLGVASVFMANCCGIDLTMNQYLAIAFASTVASIGTPGIPGDSLALMAMVFASAGIPVKCVAVAAGIDRLIDMGRTVMSVTGDAFCAVVMQRIVGKKL